MSNPLDNKIKEALENFEMPYDAGAWAQLEQQLPPSTPPPTASKPSSIWKIAAGILIIGGIIGAVMLSESDNEKISQDHVAKVQPIEQTPSEVVKPKEVKKSEFMEVEVSEEPTAKVEKDIAENVNSEAAANERILEKNEIPTLPNEDEIEAETEVREELKVLAPTPEKAPVIVDFVSSTVTACVGQDVNFMNESSGTKSPLTWDFGDGTTSNENNPSHLYMSPGVYTVTLTASESEEKQKSQTIKVNPTPTAVMSSERKLNGYQAIPLYVFSTATLPTETAVWRISDGASSVGNNATHLFRSEGNHTVKLTVTNNVGCSSSVETKMYTEKFNLLAPEAFTPNGDGINEAFIPEALAEMGIEFEMSIQNPRTGNVVYRTGNAMEPWNGKMNNVNQKLESGVYVWTVVLKEDVVKNKVFNGKISLQP